MTPNAALEWIKITFESQMTESCEGTPFFVAAAHGAEMFAISREALRNVATGTDFYRREADQPLKFFRGYGISRNDLQHFEADREFFIKRDHGGSREGIDVFQGTRSISSINCGFIDYSH